MSSLAAFSAALWRLPRVVAEKVAEQAAPRITALAKSTFDAGANAYGHSWAPSKSGGSVTLRRSGSLASFIQYVAIGNRLRVSLGTRYAKYQIGKRPIFPQQGEALPSAYVDSLIRTVRETAKTELAQ